MEFTESKNWYANGCVSQKLHPAPHENSSPLIRPVVLVDSNFREAQMFRVEMKPDVIQLPRLPGFDSSF